ncbi:MAG: helix-turn-helix domain-containing protein [Planctomycetes bacterium]|nr:helix-turn-helix domain-containing protein [Planctomycetota bacterium]
MTPLEETTVDNVSDFRKDSSRWERQQETFRKQVGRASLEQLAADWHVSPAALDALGIGFDRYAYTFPMCNAAGQVVGLHLRPKKGGKTNAPGSTLGLFLPSLPLQSRTLSTPLSTRGVTHDTLTVSPVIRRVVPFGDLQLVVEGVSDAAAALSLGFTAVGTPGAGTCGEMVVELFARRANACPCVVGDNDDAGVMGAERLREALLAARVPCRVLFPPAGFKDLRAWFVGGLTTGELQSAIEAAPVRYPRKWPAGFSMVPHALVRRGLIRQVGQTAFAVLMAIADFQDSRGRARPTRKQLAELVGISLASVARALHELREAGVLRWRSGRTNRANEYTLGLGPCAGAKKRYAAAPTWSGNGEGAALAKGELA